jgi:hypothetical protein
MWEGGLCIVGELELYANEGNRLLYHGHLIVMRSSCIGDHDHLGLDYS